MSDSRRPMPSGSAPEAWKITLPCTRAEAEAIDAAALELDMVLLTSEIVEDDRERWRLDAYTERAPDAATLATLRRLVPSAAAADAVITAVPDEDWVARSQDGLEPIRAGRFVVHTAAHAGDAPPGGRAFRIEASRAFGTGHHATTAGCLAMLDGMTDRAFGSVIDLGTGTGLLAFAAAFLWPGARVTATDIDPVAIAIARENMGVNDVSGIALIVADGALSDAVAHGAPYDLLIANILAGPLVAMAPEIAAIAAPRATIVLAGLLETQRTVVVDAFARCGCVLAGAERHADWTVLELTAAAQRHVPTAPFDPNGRDGWSLDL